MALDKNAVAHILPGKITVTAEVVLLDSQCHQIGVLELPAKLLLHPHAESLHDHICQKVGEIAAQLGVDGDGSLHWPDASWRRHPPVFEKKRKAKATATEE